MLTADGAVTVRPRVFMFRTLVPVLVWMVFLAPAWVVPLAFVASEQAMRVLFTASVVACMGSCLFAGAHCGDRDPLQWESVFVFMGVAWLMLSFGWGWFVAALRRDREKPRASARRS